MKTAFAQVSTVRRLAFGVHDRRSFSSSNWESADHRPLWLVTTRFGRARDETGLFRRELHKRRTPNAKRQTNIPDYSRVTRVYQDQNGLYEVTVRRNTSNEVLYLEPTDSVVREQTVALNAPVALTGGVVTKTVTVEQPTVDTFVRARQQRPQRLVISNQYPIIGHPH
jgi:hypothetical protein